ncbi:MAG: efflux RND transporter permease subunit, partial [Candidatus Hydrogenedentales bacterium]
MKISDLAIDRRTTIFVLLGLITLAGLYSYRSLPRESEPEIIIPFVNVSVSYPGVAPADMESLVTIPIESKLTGIAGIEEITSSSNEGSSSISIEFDPDEEISEALQRVRDKVDLARPDLPEEADDPLISEINFSEVPIVYVNVTGAVGLGELTRIAESLEDELEAVPGVLEVEVIGALEREIQIVADPVRMLHYGVSLTELIQLAQAENVNTPAGSMEVGGAKYSVRVPGEFRDASDLRDLVVKRGENGVIYLRDIADIRDGHKRIESYSRVNGEPAVLLTVSKRSGENIIQVADAIRETVERKQETLPAAVKLLVTADESSRIRYDVEQLENSILTGLLVVVVVLFMFLGFLNAIFVALAIPISLLMTFSMTASLVQLIVP